MKAAATPKLATPKLPTARMANPGLPAARVAARSGWRLSTPAEPAERRADARADAMLGALAAPAPAARPLRPLPPAAHDAAPALAARFGAGRPLDADLRGRVEPVLGHDLSRVRIYPGEAAGLADAWRARAFTAGHAVFFGAQQFRPDSREGMRVLLHELVHAAEPGDARTIHRTPSVSGWEFHNQDGGTTAADNCCALCPAALGLDSHGYGPSSFTNGMELRAYLTDDAPGATYDIKRVRETVAFLHNGGTWTRFLHEGPNKGDDNSNDDECLTPQVKVPYLPYIYSIDFPGVKNAVPFGAATDIVYQSNFREGVEISTGLAAFDDPNTFDWHAIVWVTQGPGGWALDRARSEIEPGWIKLGTKAP